MAQADDWSWDRYRPLLKLQYRQLQLDPRLRRRFDASDLVQDTFEQALENLDKFQGQSEGERVKWLQKIFRNKALDRVRAETAAKGDVRRDRSIDNAVAESTARWEIALGIEDDQPDRKAERREFLFLVADAMEKLPDGQRDAVLLVQLMGGRIAEAAEQLDRSEKAVSHLLRRGLDRLAELLPDYNPACP
jgi:RNA polymerase sigma-70 factor (ECF subfamily)